MDLCVNIRKKYKQLQSQAPNVYPPILSTLDSKYMTKLKKVVALYADHRAGVDNDYMKQLSALNGITSDLNKLSSRVKMSMQSYSKAMESGKSDLDTMKKIESNLKSYSDYESLDTTSKQMLTDVSNKYNESMFMIWVKVGVIVLILLQCRKEKTFMSAYAALAIVIAISILKYMKKPYKDDSPS
jgi:hypothetical protein